MKLFPTKRQWRGWSLPSQAGYLGLVVGVIALLVSISSWIRNENATKRYRQGLLFTDLGPAGPWVAPFDPMSLGQPYDTTRNIRFDPPGWEADTVGGAVRLVLGAEENTVLLREVLLEVVRVNEAKIWGLPDDLSSGLETNDAAALHFRVHVGSSPAIYRLYSLGDRVEAGQYDPVATPRGIGVDISSARGLSHSLRIALVWSRIGESAIDTVRTPLRTVVFPEYVPASQLIATSRQDIRAVVRTTDGLRLIQDAIEESAVSARVLVSRHLLGGLDPTLIGSQVRVRLLNTTPESAMLFTEDGYIIEGEEPEPAFQPADQSPMPRVRTLVKGFLGRRRLDREFDERWRGSPEVYWLAADSPLRLASGPSVATVNLLDRTGQLLGVRDIGCVVGPEGIDHRWSCPAGEFPSHRFILTDAGEVWRLTLMSNSPSGNWVIAQELQPERKERLRE